MYREIKGDIFKAGKGVALAHCISFDAAMGAGVAKTFRRKYPQMPEYVCQHVRNVPDVVRYIGPDGRVIYNLVTKQYCWQKPKRTDFDKCLDQFAILANQEHDMKLCLPLIGAGLDRLAWGASRKHLEALCKLYNFDMTVCYLQSKPQ